ncbi:MAG: toxin-antitoxin system HicB family antitoxin [candidate division Zixibacteria bacterium]|nr:toxin-antitoxin system HicB family antitoxin [candidate division Zixibacteria bacterium]
MSDKKPILLRISKELHDDLNAWAADDLRSLNAQIEYILREEVLRRKRRKKKEEG